jgi:hypothetical protein
MAINNNYFGDHNCFGSPHYKQRIICIKLTFTSTQFSTFDGIKSQQ